MKALFALAIIFFSCLSLIVPALGQYAKLEDLDNLRTELLENLDNLRNERPGEEVVTPEDVRKEIQDAEDGIINQVKNELEDDKDFQRKLGKNLMNDPDFEDWVRNSCENYEKISISLTLKNQTASRGEKLAVTATVNNPNDPLRRSIMTISLEARAPGQSNFVDFGAPAKMVSPLRYDGSGQYKVEWTGLMPFKDLKVEGTAEIRAVVDVPCEKDLLYESDSLQIINNKPQILKQEFQYFKNDTDSAMFDENTRFMAVIQDDDRDDLDVALHIFYQDEKNGTLIPWIIKSSHISFRPEDKLSKDVTFSNEDYGFFNNSAAGKNFSYCFSASDGLAETKLSPSEGPRIKEPPKIKFDKLQGYVSDRSQSYWWKDYAFSVSIENIAEDTDYQNLTVSVIPQISMPGAKGGWRSVGSSSEPVGVERGSPAPIKFDVPEPFDPSYCGQKYWYRFLASVSDGQGNIQSATSEAAPGETIIDPRVIRNDPLSWTAIISMLLIVLLALTGGFAIVHWRLRNQEEVL